MSHSPTALPIRRALLSVSDKHGLMALAQALHDRGVMLISTGGTAKALRDHGLPVTDVSEITGLPEMLDGRVKTLHPKIHGGLLAIRHNPEHQMTQANHGIANIDLLVVNLYPFEETVARGGNHDEIIENIDIGGPAMIRAAAKNHHDVTVLVNPADYAEVMQELIDNDGATSLATRQKLAAKAFSRTAAYDAAISQYVNRFVGDTLPDDFAIGGKRVQSLRYGENPHQQAGFYTTPDLRPGLKDAVQLQGKALSYNNLNDTDAALDCLSEFATTGKACCVIVKHANPCGVAIADQLDVAYARALACDPTSAFGGIIAINQTLDLATATAIGQIFTEVILAPAITDEAKAFLASKKNLRLLILKILPDAKSPALQVKTIIGGMLVQTRDNQTVDDMTFQVVTTRHPSPREWDDLKFAFRVAKHVKSNAIVYAKDGLTLGIGAGQMSRIDSARIAVRKNADAVAVNPAAIPDLQGSVVASDAFFPFADGLLQAAEAGVSAVIQPGGSVRDDEVIAVANDRGLTMVFTGVRHFRH
jgi:phosphoribosylaminoimidazolecarboxamide formyltransferase / IMP cyclohydrolase